MSTTGERVFIDGVRHQSGGVPDNTHGEVLDEVFPAEEVQHSVNVTTAPEVRYDHLPSLQNSIQSIPSEDLSDSVHSTTNHEVVLERDSILAEEVLSVEMSTTGEIEEGAVQNATLMNELFAQQRAHDAQLQKQLQNQTLLKQLVSHIDALSGDIADFIDENPITHVSLTVADLDAMISKIEEYRSVYRVKHRELEHSVGNDDYSIRFLPDYTRTLREIKSYIVDVKGKRNAQRLDQDLARNDVAMQQAKKLEFLRSEADRQISHLELVFDEDLSEISDEDVTTRKSALPDQQKQIQSISQCIQNLIDAGAKDQVIDEARERYVELTSSKSL